MTADPFQTLVRAAVDVPLDDPTQAERTLAERLDPTGAEARLLNDELRRLLDAGEIAHRGELPVRWSRAAKPSQETSSFSIDVVHMNGAGPRHRHPGGEIDYCIALDGAPRFDGREPGWVVFPPDSVHVPTVTGGTMLIVYLLPEGKIEFLEAPA